MEKVFTSLVMANKRGHSLLFSAVRSTVVASLLAMVLVVSLMTSAQMAYAQSGPITLTEDFTLTSDITTGSGTAGTANFYKDNTGGSSSPPGLVN